MLALVPIILELQFFALSDRFGNSRNAGMSVLLFALPRYLLVALLCTAAYVIGNAILRRLKFAGPPERLAICTAFGLGLLSHVILLMGIVGWLTPTGLIGGIIALGSAVMLIPRKPGRAAETARPFPHFSRLTWSLLALGLITTVVLLWPLLLLPLYPPTDFDETMVHLAVPKMWLAARAVIVTPFLRNQILPQSAQTLFAALMLTKDDIAPQVLSLVSTGLIGIGLYGWGKRAHGINAGILAATVWLGSPIVLALAPIASYHALATLFAFGSFYAIATYATTRQITWLFLAGFFTGVAQSTWPLSILFLPILAVASVYFTFNEKRFKTILAIVGGIMLGWGPALIRAIWHTGNPFYPLLTEVFGTGPWWTTADFVGVTQDIHRFGLRPTFKNFFILPYALFAHPDKFHAIETYSIGLFLFMPLVAIRSALNKYTRWLAAMVLFYVIAWFYFGQVMRYLILIIPVICIITALAICWLIDSIFGRDSKWGSSLVAVAVLGLLIPSALFLRKEAASRGPIPIAGDKRAAYIAARIPEYPAMMVANKDPALVYSLFGANAAYYADGTFMGDYFGPGRYSNVLASFRDGQSLYSTLHQLGARYFLISRVEGLVPPLPDDSQFDSHFEPIFANSAAELYRIHDVPRIVPANHPNLLRNSGFDDVVNKWPAGWTHFGAPVVGAPENGAASGKFAVEVTDKDGLQQPVRVTPGNIYELELQAEADRPGKVFRLQVNWLSKDGQICEVFIRVCTATTDWQRYSCKLTAPPCAELAQVYASGQSSEFVWLDSFVLKNETSKDSVH
jgi:hypothetical protein